MIIVNQSGKYHTPDKQVFATLALARGHTHRLAIAQYLLVLRRQLHEETGPISPKLRESLLDLGDAIGDIFDEKIAMEYEAAGKQVAYPAFLSRKQREKRDAPATRHAAIAA